MRVCLVYGTNVLPADAGMSPGRGRWEFSPSGAPRRRGDEPQIALRLEIVYGCSPQTRG